jgi:hypothetical protein
MFRALFAHSQELLHKQHLVCCVRVMSAGCTRVRVQCSAGCAATPEDEQVMLKTCRGPYFLIKNASCWFHYTDVL